MPNIIATHRPVMPSVKPTWQECSIIFRDDCGTIRAVDGWRYGTLTVHATQDGDLSKGCAVVTVTHEPSKIAVIRVSEVEDAISCAERLWELCREAFASLTEHPDKNKIPKDVETWIIECNANRRFLP